MEGVNEVDVSRFKLIEVAKLKKADWNYKEENSELQSKLVANIQRNGQIENLLVRHLGDGSYEVVNGNHRLDVLKQLGYTKALVYDFGDITLDDAKRISIETNETKFIAKEIKLATLIAEAVDKFSMEDVVATFPFSQTEIDEYLKMSTFDWDEFRGEEVKRKEDLASEKAKNSLSFTLSEEDLILWQEWKQQQAHGATDYEAFISAVKIAKETV